MADSSDEVTFDVTWSEIARAVLLRVFKRISPVLGAHVRSAYQEVYGEDGWLTAGKDCLSRRMLAKIEKTPDVLLHDIFIMTELMAARLDRVFLGRWFRGVVGASHHSALLQRLSADVDCVSRTRTWLFHGVDVSIGEVYRCVESVVRLVTRLPLNVCQHFIDELEGDLQVCLVRAHNVTHTYCSSTPVRMRWICVDSETIGRPSVCPSLEPRPSSVPEGRADRSDKGLGLRPSVSGPTTGKHTVLPFTLSSDGVLVLQYKKCSQKKETHSLSQDT